MRAGNPAGQAYRGIRQERDGRHGVHRGSRPHNRGHDTDVLQLRVRRERVVRRNVADHYRERHPGDDPADRIPDAGSQLQGLPERVTGYSIRSKKGAHLMLHGQHEVRCFQHLEETK